MKGTHCHDGAVANVGVYVLGMHRSGTSATTRLINLMGVSLCVEADLLGPAKGNEHGLWESATLVRFNDALLRQLGGAWWCPPRPNQIWPQHTSIAHQLGLARQVFQSVHRTVQWAWKDPRTCVTLPFWLRALEQKPVVILVIRNPLEIAASLIKRNKFTLPFCLALWERYLQNILPNLAGLPVFVTSFDEILSSPQSWCRRARRFLVDQGVVLGPQDPDRIDSFIDHSSRHYTYPSASLDGRPEIPAAQKALFRILIECFGTHNRFTAPSLPVESPDTDGWFAELRHSYGLTPRPATVFQPFKQLLPLPNTKAKPEPPCPPVSIIVISRNEGNALSRTINGLTRTMPRTAEILVVDDASSDGSADFLAKGYERVRLIRSSRQLGVSRARNAGAAEATGEILVFSDAHVMPAAGWFRLLAPVLARPEVGAAGPSLVSKGMAKTYGLTFTDTTLNVDWLPRQASKPYPVPLLPGSFFAIRRQLFLHAGSFDPAMVGYGAEDLDLCLRLWRMGLECIIVPECRVVHAFRVHPASKINWEEFLFNRLRLGISHLGEANLTEFLAALRRVRYFDRAMGRVIASDTFRRRAELNATTCYDDAWFFRRFGISFYTRDSLAGLPEGSRRELETAANGG
jgi:GT2 family glycosyltransferase